MHYVKLFFDWLSYISMAGMVTFAIYSFFDKENGLVNTKIKPSKPKTKVGEQFSDSSLYDEVCELCGATDAADDNRLEQPCVGKPKDPEPEPQPEPVVQSLVYRLEERARIRRQIPSRKSVQEGKPDRIADLLEEAAKEIKMLKKNSISVAKIEALAKHIKENAGALRQWVEQEDEARCRELCAMYLEELVTTLRIEQRIDDLNLKLADLEDITGPFDNVEDVIKSLKEDDKND